MAEIQGFRPSVTLNGSPFPSLRGVSSDGAAGKINVRRAATQPSVRGDGRFPSFSAAGVGNFRRPLVKLTLAPSDFAAVSESETPAVIAIRDPKIKLPRGGKIDVFA